ncbi:hypothetical protein VTJ83DRAFT_4727 [Remersonia thermophila]|uniref:Methyltransferase n=1 Tax=Remersonia thermophila TaxID=72144 RepID=A0ABR4DBI8_9PEZI
MTLRGFLQALGAPVHDVEEETFDLFAQDLPSQNLGFVDSRASTVDITVAGRDFTIHQSPAVLSSNRAGGTTGAVLWKVTPLFAEWLAAPANPLFAHGVLSSSSVVLELGCGVSALVGLLLAPRVARCILTDQPYVARLVELNIAENAKAAAAAASAAAAGALSPRGGTPSAEVKKSHRERGARARKTEKASSPGLTGPGLCDRVGFAPLDWETDVVTPALASWSGAGTPPPQTARKGHSHGRGNGTGKRSQSFDVVLCCDCVYNEALIEPLVSTCADACRLRAAAPVAAKAGGNGGGGGDGAAAGTRADGGCDDDEGADDAPPTVCVVVQQLRDPSVFEAWLGSFSRRFAVWRVPDEMLALPGLKSSSGFVVHVGVLKGEVPEGLEVAGSEGE